MNKGFRHFFSISIVFLFTIAVYFLIAGNPLSAQPSPVRKALPDQVAPGLPAKAWEKVRQTLERDGFEGALTAGPDAQTVRIKQKAGLRASGPDRGEFFGCYVAISGDTVVVGASRKNLNTGAVYILNGIPGEPAPGSR